MERGIKTGVTYMKPTIRFKVILKTIPVRVGGSPVSLLLMNVSLGSEPASAVRQKTEIRF